MGPVSWYKVSQIYISSPPPFSVIIHDKAYVVEIVDTDASRAKGLSLHAPLFSNEGMLFIFEQPGNYGFWMKDMLFPIDIIWIDADLKVTHIEKSLSPNTYPKLFYPTTPSKYVLEVSAGESEKLNLKIGDTVTFVKK